MNLYLNFLNMQKIQLNLSTTATSRTEERRWGGGGYKEVAVVERIKQESMYGLFVHRDKKVAVVEIRWPLHFNS